MEKEMVKEMAIVKKLQYQYFKVGVLLLQVVEIWYKL